MIYIATHAVALCGLIAVLYLPVSIVEAAAGVALVPPAYPHLSRLLGGLLFWIAIVFILAATELLSTASVWTVVALVAASAAFTAVRRPISLKSVWRAGTAVDRGWPLHATVALAAIAATAVALFLLALRPIPAWDADTYHLTVPRLYIEHGGFRRIGFNVYSNWPMDVEMLYTLGMLLQDYLLATLVHLAFALFTIAALQRALALRGFKWAGPLAAILFLANEVVLAEAGTAYVDVAFGFFFLMAVLFAVEAGHRPQDRERRHYLLFCGISSGLMAGVKLTGLFVLPAVGALALAHGWRSRRVWNATGEFIVLVAVPCVLLAAPWYFKSFWYTGNPVYPVLHGVFGGVEWNATLATQLYRWQHGIGMGRGIVDYLLLPLRVILSAGDRYDNFGASAGHFWAPLLLIVAVMTCFDQDVRSLALASGIYFGCWALSSQQMRFLIPVIAVMALAGALSIARVMRYLAGAPVLRVVLRPAIVCTVAGAYLLFAARPFVGEALASAAQYRLKDRRMPRAAIPAVYRVINERLPHDARVLCLATNHGFFLEREYLADSFFEASQVKALIIDGAATSGELAARLRERGITHLLVGTLRVDYGRPIAALLTDSTRTRLMFTSEAGEQLFALEENTGAGHQQDR